MERMVTGALIAFLWVAIVQAQAEIIGTWQGKTPNGFELELNVTATGDAVTGTFTRNRQSVPISDGKVTKSTFTFTAIINDQAESVTGEIVGDQMRLWLDRQGRDRAAILKKRDRLTGTWQGTTASGRPLVLDLNVNEQQLTGRLTVAQQSTHITEGKVEGQTFSLTAGPLDGRTVVANGRLVGEEVELTVQGVGNPLTLKRVK
jgi:hypothetical protein